MRFIPVPAVDYPAWREKVWPVLAEKLASDAFPAADLERDVLNRDRQMWIAYDGTVRAVCLTSVLRDGLDTVTVTHCGGDGMHDWAHFLALIEAWARETGARRFEVVCRPGWERVLRPFGLTKTHVVLEKRL